MPISRSDILTKYSTTSGSAGNSNSGTPTNNLGKYISTTQWTGGVINDLFPDITGDQNASIEGDTLQ